MTRTGTLAGYAALAVAMVVLEVHARRTGRVATLARAVSALAGNRAIRLTLLAAWLWVGWHVFVRAHR